MPGPRLDVVAALDFLERWAPGGPWLPVAIAVDQRRVEARTFRASDLQALELWLVEHAGDNLYFHVNPTTRDLDKKAERADVAALAWLHVDIDPRKGEDIERERERALALLRSPPGGIPPPTVVVFSGGGYQGFWKLRDPLPIGGDLSIAEEAKRYNLQLEVAFGADNCHNVDRIMRLPGTVNWPTAKKRARGREPAAATVVEWDASRVYDVAAFMKAPVSRSPDSQPARAAPGNVRRLSSVDELGPGVDPLCKDAIVNGIDSNDETRWGGDRSRALHYVCCELARAGLDDETIYSVITDPDFRISASVLDKGSQAEKYALRQIERARDKASSPELYEMNERHAVIRSFGGKCRVIEELPDAATGRPRLVHSSFDDVCNAYMNRLVDVPAGDGKTRQVPLGKWWLSHGARRQYDRVVFSPEREVPGAYNLWHGFACDAKPGDCSLFLAHARDNLCGGDASHLEWLLSWMARAVQRPAEQGHVAVVLRGPQGTGKSFFARTFGSLWGRHFLQISDPKHLVGSFNAHLRDCCVLFADEAFYAGDRRHESILKTLITEEVVAIEAKGVDVEPSPNYLHVIMASNADWVVPAGYMERRFFVLDVADGRAQDTEYFSAVRRQLDSGGREALLHLLLSRDVSGFDPRKVPRTAALDVQTDLSLDPAEAWWSERLRRGRLLETQEGWDEVELNALTYNYRSTVGSRYSAQKWVGRELRSFLASVCGGKVLAVRRGTPAQAPDVDGRMVCVRKPYYLIFPPLARCRELWEARLGHAVEWEAEEVPGERVF